jgi:DNA-binding winged helix-turn-helix (wHTH) protein
MKSQYNAPSDLCCARVVTTSTSPAPGLLRSKRWSSGRRISWCSTWGFPILKAPKSVDACGRPPPCQSSCSRPDADDYVTKPFGPEELLARIRVALRRLKSEDETESGRFRAGDLTIDYDRRRVFRNDTEMRLTPKEFELVSLLARNHDRVLTHRAILKEIWGANAVEQPEHLWTLIAQLRKKLEPDPANPRYLLSEPWVGYRFSTEDQLRSR